ncbi:uncharacterized protein [Palaemon carinicauda]|uniref:uncharacterized protein n=1 Tax=Palaemon carinicauda TaxID=392227 RepID=UPI0035B5730F
MWSDNSHTHSFPHTPGFSHAPGLDRLCLNSRLGCVLANGLRDGTRIKFFPHSAALKDTTPMALSTQVSAEAAIFVAVIVVF